MYSLEEKINRFAIFSRLGIISLQFLANFILPDHEAGVFQKPLGENATRTHIDRLVEFALGGLTRWDGQYYLHIAQYGYTYENTLAFFPLFPMAIRQLTYLALFFLEFIFPGLFSSVEKSISAHSALVLISVIFNNFLFVRTANLLFKLSVIVLKSEKLAFFSAILFCVNPASIFFSAAYSESLYCFLTFYGLLRLEMGNSFVNHIIIGLTGAVRSNGLVNLGFGGYKYLKMWYDCEISLFRSSIYFLGMTLAALPFAIYQLYCYVEFCSGERKTNVPDFVRDHGISNGFVLPGNKSKWCDDFFPLAYGHVQKRYWNVGFLNYYEPKQIPNFLLAAPMIYVIARGSFEFVKRYKRSILSLGFKEFKDGNYDGEFLKISAFPYVCHGIALTIFSVLVVHVQVTTRLLASSTPLPYWYCARILSGHESKNSSAADNVLRKLRKNERFDYYIESGENRRSRWKTFLFTDSFRGFPFFIKWYFLTYFFVGTVMFSNFLPWT